MFTSLYFVTSLAHGGNAFQYFAQSNLIFVKCKYGIGFSPCKNKSELETALQELHGEGGVPLAVHSILQDIFINYQPVQQRVAIYDDIFPDFPL